MLSVAVGKGRAMRRHAGVLGLVDLLRSTMRGRVSGTRRRGGFALSVVGRTMKKRRGDDKRMRRVRRMVSSFRCSEVAVEVGVSVVPGKMFGFSARRRATKSGEERAKDAETRRGGEVGLRMH